MPWYEYVTHAVVIFIGFLIGNLLGQKISERRRKRKKTNEN